MTDAVSVSPLRQQMIEDMTIRRFGEHTQRDYVRQVRAFTAFLGSPPDRAEPEDLRRYQLHLATLGASYARMNQACTALRFFFHVTLGRTGFGDRMARVPTPERLQAERSRASKHPNARTGPRDRRSILRMGRAAQQAAALRPLSAALWPSPCIDGGRAFACVAAEAWAPRDETA
ncbi:MAG TPA: phage integrase N-terminal SAM-like domain-containing protein [Bosea sp. (in: a-proteobacteria)]